MLLCPACCCSEEDEEGTEQEYSMCTWNVDSVKGYSVRARRNSNVLVEFNLKAGMNRICPNVTVITNVTFGKLEACPSDIAASQYIQMRAATARQKLNTETCARDQGQGRTLSYAFKVNNPAGSRNKCAELRVETSDEVVQIMLLRYID
jgi:hypothetical protein